VDIVLLLHSLVRFVILLVAVVGVIKVLIVLVQKSKPDQIDQMLASVFTGLYDLQVLLGLLLILLGGLTQAIHPIVMFVGVLLAHGLQVMTKRAEGVSATMYRLALFVIPLLVILAGLATIGHLPV
jgi:hypothetical protein